MGETVVWNKKLLVASLLLGLVAAILFYAHEQMQESQASKRDVRVLKWKINRSAGQEVAKEDIIGVLIPRASFRDLDNVLEDNQSNRNLAVGYHLGRDVRRNDFVRVSDILEYQAKVPSRRIRHDQKNKVVGYRAFPLRVDPYRTVGDLLRVDDRVDLIGLVSVNKKPPRAYPLIENLKVLAVGGKSQSPREALMGARGGGREESSLRVYRTLAVEVHKDVAVQLAELLPRVRGKIWVVVRHPEEKTAATDGKINRALLPVLNEPLPEDFERD